MSIDGDCVGLTPEGLYTPPAKARELYQYFVERIRAAGLPCQTGRFQEKMTVELANDGPVTILLTGSNYTYTKISITLTQSWYGITKGSYPPYGHGAHHTTTHIHVAVNDPTTNLIRY